MTNILLDDDEWLGKGFPTGRTPSDPFEDYLARNCPSRPGSGMTDEEDDWLGKGVPGGHTHSDPFEDYLARRRPRRPGTGSDLLALFRIYDKLDEMQERIMDRRIREQGDEDPAD